MGIYYVSREGGVVTLVSENLLIRHLAKTWFFEAETWENCVYVEYTKFRQILLARCPLSLISSDIHTGFCLVSIQIILSLLFFHVIRFSSCKKTFGNHFQNGICFYFQVLGSDVKSLITICIPHFPILLREYTLYHLLINFMTFLGEYIYYIFVFLYHRVIPDLGFQSVPLTGLVCGLMIHSLLVHQCFLPRARRGVCTWFI